MKRVLIDTAVAAYALGSEHRYRDAARALIAEAGRGEIELHASVEMIQELVHHRMRRVDRLRAVAESRDMAILCVLHAFDSDVLEASLQLIAETRSLGGRDAVHAATALNAGLDTIVSPDSSFDAIPGLRRTPLS